MRSLFLLAALAWPAVAAAQAGGDLFTHLDRNGDGFLAGEELTAAQRAGHGWIAVDRDRDGRYSRQEFAPVRQAAVPVAPDPVDVVAAPAGVQGGYSARRLIGAEVVQAGGEPVGTVRDILVNTAGAVTGLVVDRGLFPPGAGQFRLPWHEAQIARTADRVVLPEAPASAGGSAAPAPLPLTGEWRASQFFDDVVQLEPGRRYADVRDLVISPWGEVQAIVVEDEPAELYAYAWRHERMDPPYDRTHVRSLRPFDYGALGIAAP